MSISLVVVQCCPLPGKRVSLQAFLREQSSESQKAWSRIEITVRSLNQIEMHNIGTQRCHPQLHCSHRISGIFQCLLMQHKVGTS